MLGAYEYSHTQEKRFNTFNSRDNTRNIFQADPESKIITLRRLY
jgi:hypothetical protein